LAGTIAGAFGVVHTAIFGILGIVVILGVGLWMLLRVHPNPTVIGN
jgi:uncharacterized membrane protein